MPMAKPGAHVLKEDTSPKDADYLYSPNCREDVRQLKKSVSVLDVRSYKGVV
jgi:hypothetical protein